MASLPVHERERILSVMRRYLNLCSEEYYLHKKGKIDNQTWDIWKTGIRDTIRLPCFDNVWGTMRCEYNYFAEFCRFMDDLVTLSGYREPTNDRH